ncbi:tumor protein p53-inducible protein 13 isoform X1 [Xyrichtys novacula]|uniref:Tumor protein p53-inducible protein 13 isoform X1 n=1 Tax=Xyrichtys novacula TaxID=13765 RepID=A0AAV1FY09_XYRNO|nr:tumor protein p53-inducible protein 13 isoform X1 [Xyrichtys novacula]
MLNQTMSPLLTVTLLVMLWVRLVKCSDSEYPGPLCDNGKIFLERDLPASTVHWNCPVSLWPAVPTQGPPSVIDTLYELEPARQICMDKSISYKQIIPNSGAFRPVRAESGEYLYCPPQRWLNNLHHGAVVLLYHPCAPLHERKLLSALARSCLPDYIITPHKQLKNHTPLVLVSWGRTLELSTMATLDVCDWLETTTSTRNKSGDLSKSGNYTLLLTRPAETQTKRLYHPEEYPAQTKVSLRQCCEQIISSVLSGAIEPGVQSHVKKRSLKQFKEKATRGKQINDIEEDVKGHTTLKRTGYSKDDNGTLGSSTDSLLENKTLSDTPKTATKTNSFTSGDSEPDKARLNIVRQLSHENEGHSSSKSSVRLDILADSVNTVHNQRHKDSVRPKKLKESEAADVKERQLKQQQTYSDTHPNSTSEKTDFNSVPKSQSEPHPHARLYPSPQQARIHHSCQGCQEGEHCECTEESWSKANVAFVEKGLRTMRNNEALWAAAALGFLLVLLTLSVLHTRLYRHWRTAPSLYWHDPRQDYDSVADVISRRIQIAKRRQKRGRRREFVLLPSSSSSDELP